MRTTRTTSLSKSTAAILASAEADEAEATRKHQNAAAQDAHATRKFFEEGSRTQRETMRMAREDLESAKHALDVATERRKHAQQVHDAKLREDDLAAYEAHKTEALGLEVRVPELAKKFIAIAEQQHAAVVEVMRAVAAAADARAQAEELAARLGMLGDLDRDCPTPDAGEAKLTIRRLTTAARLTANTPDVSSWWAGVEDDPRRQSLTAREMRSSDEFVRHTNAEAQGAAARALAEQLAVLRSPQVRAGGPRPLSSPEPEEG